ncbi:MAG: glycosyltransferase family 4 protein [Lachnospiraceae bacterium]|nr:glycosyltransferase family 4 protein [Lachnospiraceae bacterium]
MKKHILVISQYFYPENFRINDMAREWVKRGYKITVLTGIPNYPMGKFFDGYSWTQKRYEKWNGIKIIRIPVIARGQGSVRMVLNYLSFMVSGWLWNRFINMKADMVFSFEVSPMTQVKVGCDYAKKHGVPHFVYVQDLWPDNVETVTGIHNRAIIGPIDRMVDKIYRQVDRIFVTSPSFVKAVVNRKVHVDRRKVTYWPQYAEEFYRPLSPQKVDGIDSSDTSFKIAFTGNIGTAQGLDVLPKAAMLLKNENVKFIIVGDGRYQEVFEKKIKTFGVEDKFIMIPRVEAEKIPMILSVCDAGFISFNKTPLWEKTIPAKLQSYMACGKAIVASASGETERIINDADCGICCKIGNARALADGIRKIMQLDVTKMGENSRKYFEREFDKKKLMDEMDKYINGWR